jgi:hypothetical protein
VRRDDDNETVLYEVSLEADAELEGPFDTWLRDHVADMLQLEGFLGAEILDDPTPPPGRLRRSVHYRVRDRDALERCRREQEPALRERAVALFGDRFNASQRVLGHREEFVRGKVSTENCLNCGEVLSGQHCSHCGQPAKVRVLSLWGLVRDVVGDLLNADSRVWRTLWPLAFRPGLLTQDYLRGRRTRYTPPFRMYLVLSVVFFVLASLEDPGRAIELDLGENEANLQIRDPEAAPAADAGGAATAGDAATPAPAAPEAQTGPGGPIQKAEPLDADARKLVDGVVARVPQEERARVREALERELSASTPEQRAAARQFLDDPCGEDSLRLDLGPDVKPVEDRLRSACRKIVADQQGFGRALFDNVPKMMFIFLPLIAAVLAVLYLRSGRYYVEHLLFVVHFHAFFFLAGIAVLLLDHLTGILPGAVVGLVKVAQGLLATALVFYVPVYLFMALRRVYGQSRWRTLPKYAILGIAYFFSMVLTGLGLLAYTALSL